MNWRLYWSITTSNYEIKEFRSAISSLNAHQRECQRLEETEDSQIPLVVEDIDGVFREMVQTPDNFTSSDSHDNQLRPKEKTTASLLCLVKSVANCVHLINWWNTRNNLSKRWRSSFWFSFRKERLFTSDLTYFRFSRLHQDQLNNGREDDPFTFPNFTMEGAPYDLMANIFCDLEDRRWPFEMMRNMWSWTWLTKLFYARAEICKFNPCLCITSSSTGIIFFLTVFLKELVKRENIVTRTFSIQLVTSLLKPKICMRWISVFPKY